MKSSLLVYKLGIGTIGIFTILLVGLVVLEATATKQDAATTKQANMVANKLNNYIDMHSMAPQSLAAVGIHDVRRTITYERQSDTKYKFCQTYRLGNTTVTPSNITSLVIGRSIYKNFSGSSMASEGYLYIPITHHKGVNCQTVTLSKYSSDSLSTSNSTTDTYCSQPHSGGSVDDATVDAVSLDSSPATIAVRVADQKTYNLTTSVTVFDANCEKVTADEILTGDSVRLIFTQPNDPTVASIIDTSF